MREGSFLGRGHLSARDRALLRDSDFYVDEFADFHKIIGDSHTTWATQAGATPSSATRPKDMRYRHRMLALDYSHSVFGCDYHKPNPDVGRGPASPRTQPSGSRTESS